MEKEKKFLKPEAEIIALINDDIITESDPADAANGNFDDIL